MAHWDGSGGPLGRLWRHLWAPRGLWERFRGHFGTSFGSIFDEKLDKSDAKCGVLLFGHIFQRIVVFFWFVHFSKRGGIVFFMPKPQLLLCIHDVPLVGRFQTFTAILDIRFGVFLPKRFFFGHFVVPHGTVLTFDKVWGHNGTFRRRRVTVWGPLGTLKVTKMSPRI